MTDNPFEILGIDPTNDVERIRKAYNNILSTTIDSDSLLDMKIALHQAIKYAERHSLLIDVPNYNAPGTGGIKLGI